MDLDKILSILGSHWSFVAVAIVLAIVGEVVKTIVLGDNKREIEKTTWKRIFKQSMPIHPVLVGGLLGLVLSTTVPEMIESTGIIGSVLYFALSGAVSTWVYNTLKKLLPNVVASAQEKLASTVSKKKKKEEAEEE